MKRPANPGGVVVGVVFAVLVLVGGYLVGWDETTRRGLPVGLGSVVAAACFGWLAVRSWRTPRPPGDARTRAGRGARAALGGAAVYVGVALVAAAVGVVVASVR